MEANRDRIQQLIERPGESLAVEIKRWINPNEPEGQAKIIKGVLALRNHGGGYFVIGFDDRTLQPDTEHAPSDARQDFHLDKIQHLITKFSSEPFEIGVEFPEREGQPYPVIVVPPGVKTPVATKSSLSTLIATNDVFVRSLNSNNTPSSVKAIWKDWPALMDVCFDNREADIGRFLRRHLSGVTPDVVRHLATSLIQGTTPEISIKSELESYLQEGEARYHAAVQKRKLNLPEHGSWEVALILAGNIPAHSANQNFLRLLDANNPSYTGWPVWLNSQGFRDQESHPYVIDGAWEALIVSPAKADPKHLDFWRLDPKGRFYLRRGLQDDFSDSPQAPEPRTELDFVLAILRTAEAIAVGLAFAKAMGGDSESVILSFAFRWKGLQNRILSSWADWGRYLSSDYRAYQDEITTFVDVPLAAPLSALVDYVMQVVTPLFEIFDGWAVGKPIVDDLTRRLVERKL